MLFLITTHRQTGGFRGDPLPQGLTSWEVLQYVARTRQSVTHTSRHMHTHLENIYPKATAINLQHTPLNIQCLGISESHCCRLSLKSGIFLINLLTSQDSLLPFFLSLLELPHTLASFCPYIPFSSLSLTGSSLPFFLSTSGLAESSSLPVNVDSLFSLNTHDPNTRQEIFTRRRHTQIPSHSHL